MRIEVAVLQALNSLNVDYIISHGSDCLTNTNTFYLHKGKYIGVYIETVGLVLPPIYHEVKRLGDIVMVVDPDHNDPTNYFGIYGGYHIHKKTWVIPQVYKRHEFWRELDRYREIEKNHQL